MCSSDLDEFQAAYDAGEFLTRAADVPGFIRADLLRQESDEIGRASCRERV